MKHLARIVVALVIAALVVLVPVACKNGRTGQQLYHCPMHPTYTSDKPGDCPICGMRLVPVEKTTPTPASVAKTTGKKILFYRNPMDPSVTSPVPMKDSMGMDYVPVYEEEPSSSSSVAGYAPVMLEPAGISRSGIQTVEARRGQLGEAVRAVGTVVPDERRVTQVFAKVSGWVEQLFVTFTGQWVEKGQPLLSMYSPELLASQEEYLRSLQLVKELAQASPSAQQAARQLQQAARQRLLLFDVPESFIAHLEDAGQPSRTVTLTAPHPGYVLAKETFAGRRIEPGTELYRLADLRRVWVLADFYEQEASWLSLNMPARVTLPYQPGEALDGVISYIYPTVEPESRTVRVRVELANREGRLKPDMYAHVEVELRTTEGLVVPDSAVMDTGTRNIVFVEEKPGFFVPREVTVLHRSGGKALVSKGLAEGERVVVKGTFLLDSESRLRAALAAPKGGDRGPAHH